ncbi:MAG: MerR family transcriptional regulator [Spirochaetales bacterium]|nr:MerR family transcriptional regulator [Spirochaetales bacterium]
MRKYSIGEVCGMLGVKPHVVRYWEQEIPFLSSRKTKSGRRTFSDRDLRLLQRLKYLLYEKRYTIEGARNRIWEEINAPHIDLKIRIAEIRSELMELLHVMKKSGPDP